MTGGAVVNLPEFIETLALLLVGGGPEPVVIVERRVRLQWRPSVAVGITLLIGWQARWSALILAIWCVATAMVAHDHPDDRNQMIHFMKNICMAGGFLQLFAFGAGRLSLDRR